MSRKRISKGLSKGSTDSLRSRFKGEYEENESTVQQPSDRITNNDRRRDIGETGRIHKPRTVGVYRPCIRHRNREEKEEWDRKPWEDMATIMKRKIDDQCYPCSTHKLPGNLTHYPLLI